MKFICRPYLAAMLFTALVLSNACGQSGKSGEGSTSAPVGTTEETISGSIVSQTGGQREMAGWVVVMTERDSAVSRVSEVDQAGSFSLKGVDSTKFQTITLLSSDHKLAAVLSIPGIKTATVRQYFKVKSKTLPRLIHKGAIVEFFATTTLEVDTGVATDSDSDRTPNGIDTTPTGAFTGMLLAASDTDSDGISNEKDLDIDGDGTPNIFDTDADNDLTLNVFDSDANGDGVIDAAQKFGIQYFSDGVDFIAVQLTSEPQTNGSTRTILTITTKLKDGVSPAGVRLRGPQALLNAATVETTEATTGQTISQPFDGNLNDDGNSNDGSAADRVYARRIVLATDKTPKSNQVVFVQLAFGNSPNNWFKEFAYTFPSVTLASVGVTYDSNVDTISIIGTPFGAVDSYFWSADIFNSTGGKVHSTSISAGSTTLQSLPSDLLTAGESYEAVIYAQSIDPVPGYPAYIVKSLPTAL